MIRTRDNSKQNNLKCKISFNADLTNEKSARKKMNLRI